MGSEVFGVIVPKMGHRDLSYNTITDIKHAANAEYDLGEAIAARDNLRRRVRDLRITGKQYLNQAVKLGWRGAKGHRDFGLRDLPSQCPETDVVPGALIEARWYYARAAFFALLLKTV